MKLEVFEATNEAELGICRALRHRIFVMEKKVPQSIESDELDIIGGVCRHFWIECDGVPAGAVRCNESHGDVMKIQRFCVLANYRQHGVGRHLMKYIEDFYRKLGWKKIQLGAKFHICGFYEKCGYVKASDIYIEADVEHVDMIKEIV